MLRDFFVSKVRVKLLKYFFSHSQEMFYGRQLSRRIDEQINAVRRELNNLKKTGLLKSEERSNRIYFFLNENYFLYDDLLAIVLKTTGLGAAIRKNISRLGKIQWVFFSRRLAKNLSVPKENKEAIDIFVVGEVILPELSALVAKEEKNRHREINYSVMDKSEFIFRYQGKDPFLWQILVVPRFTIWGGEKRLLD